MTRSTNLEARFGNGVLWFRTSVLLSLLIIPPEWRSSDKLVNWSWKAIRKLWEELTIFSYSAVSDQDCCAILCRRRDFPRCFPSTSSGTAPPTISAWAGTSKSNDGGLTWCQEEVLEAAIRAEGWSQIYEVVGGCWVPNIYVECNWMLQPTPPPQPACTRTFGTLFWF